MHARHVPVYLVLLGVLNTVYAGFDEVSRLFSEEISPPLYVNGDL